MLWQKPRTNKGKNPWNLPKDGYMNKYWEFARTKSLTRNSKMVLFLICSYFFPNFLNSLHNKTMIYNIGVTSATKPLMCNSWIFSFWKKKCFVLEISRLLCFCEIHRFQNLWHHHRHCYIMEITLMLISLESQVLSKWNFVKY